MQCVIEGETHERATVANGEISVRSVGGRHRFATCRAEAPLVLRPVTSRFALGPALAYVGQLGGGWLAGDRQRLTIDVGDESALVLRGQASSRAYGGPGSSRWTLAARIGRGASLSAIAEPVVPSWDSEWSGESTFELAPGGSLVAWDAFTAGRVAMGERFRFRRFANRIELRTNGTLVLRDAVAFRGDEAARGSGPMTAFASFVVAGPRFADRLDAVVEQVNRERLGAFTRRGDVGFARFAVEHPGALSELRDRLVALVVPSGERS